MRNIVVLMLCLGFLASPAFAQNFDPFRPNSSPTNNLPGGKNVEDYDPNVRNSRPTTSQSSSLMDLKLSEYDQEQFDACRTEARKYGTDIMQLSSVSGFLGTPYRTQSCSKFVVEKMLNSMDTAMRNDPEALVEFQRNKDIQHKYDELKKAYTILSRGNPVTGKTNYSGSNLRINNNYAGLNSYNTTPSTQLLSQPDAWDDPNMYMVQPKPSIPQEWWAKDYYQVDMAKTQAQIASQQEHRNRILSPEGQGFGPNPLKSIMMQAEGKEQERLSNRRGGGGGNYQLPSFQTQDPYQ